MLQKRRDTEESAKKRVALPPELEIGALGRVAGDLEARQDVNSNIVLFDELAMLGGDALPRGFGRVARFPNQAAAFLQSFKRIGVRESLGVAAKNYIYMVQLFRRNTRHPAESIFILIRICKMLHEWHEHVWSYAFRR